MKTIGIFFGTETGTTRLIARRSSASSATGSPPTP
jgi:flavodoxin